MSIIYYFYVSSRAIEAKEIFPITSMQLLGLQNHSA
jgi:hypothetical protein